MKKLILVNDDNFVTASGTEDFLADGIEIGETGNRHWTLEIRDADGCYNYEYVDGDVLARETKPELLGILKNKKIEQIKQKTTEIINRGINYNGHTIYMGPADIANWAHLMIGKDALDYPYPIDTKDNGVIEVEDAAELAQMYAVGMGTIAAIKSHEKGIVDSVKRCNTVQAVQNIIDTRG